MKTDRQYHIVEERTVFHCVYFLLFTAMLSLGTTGIQGQTVSTISLQDKSTAAGIDFVHYAPRPRWCEIGPTVVGAATNEGLSLVFKQENEYWKSNGRLMTMDEFANVHLIKMNGSGGSWLDYDRDGDWDLYLVNCQGDASITNALFENLGEGKFTRVNNSGAEDDGEGMAVSSADYNNDSYPDLLVSNYGDYKLFHNNGDKTFSNVSATAFPDGIKDMWYGGSAWGDYDNDGDLDLYITGMLTSREDQNLQACDFRWILGGYPIHCIETMVTERSAM